MIRFRQFRLILSATALLLFVSTAPPTGAKEQSAVGKAVAFPGKAVRGTLGFIGRVSSGIFEGGREVVVGTYRAVGTIATGVIDGVGQVQGGIFSGAVNTVTGVFDRPDRAVKNVGRGVGQMVSSPVYGTKTIAKGTYDGVSDVSKSARNGTEDVLHPVVSPVLDSVHKIGDRGQPTSVAQEDATDPAT